MAKTTAFRFGAMLVEAGVITREELNNTRRIVIDATADHGVMVYVEKYGDTEALANLAPMLKGMFDNA
jgi:hypothetical protein